MPEPGHLPVAESNDNEYDRIVITQRYESAVTRADLALKRPNLMAIGSWH